MRVSNDQILRNIITALDIAADINVVEFAFSRNVPDYAIILFVAKIDGNDINIRGIEVVMNKFMATTALLSFRQHRIDVIVDKIGAHDVAFHQYRGRVLWLRNAAMMGDDRHRGRLVVQFIIEIYIRQDHINRYINASLVLCEISF
jgi:hypothetical protein